MKEGFYFYWAAFNGAYVAVDKHVQLAIHVYSRPAKTFLSRHDFAFPLA
jgi:hypothetical protein